MTPDHPERLDEAVKQRRERRVRWQREGLPSIGRNLALIGVLGWTIVTPTLIGMFVGPVARSAIRLGTFLGRSDCSSWVSRSVVRSPGKGCIRHQLRRDGFQSCSRPGSG